MLPIVCFSGSIGSGKSSISKAIAQMLGCQRAGFGDYVRHLVEQAGGNPNSRKEQQDLGQSNVDTDPSAFCDGLLGYVGFKSPEQLVVDGIRHDIVFSLLKKKLYPQQVFLLHLDVEENTRLNRFEIRDGSIEGFNAAHSHEVEQESESRLPAIADCVIDANKPFDEVVKNSLQAIQWLSAED